MSPEVLELVTRAYNAGFEHSQGRSVTAPDRQFMFEQWLDNQKENA
jgi:hypothetical protein